MNSIIESLTGMDKMSDQVIATDFMISAKTRVRNHAMALTESTSPEVRAVLQEQFKVDLQAACTALNLTQKTSLF